MAQTQTNETQPTGILRLSVKPKINGKEKGLARTRFYLITGDMEANKALIERITQPSLPTLECYYRAAQASEAFINWLKEGDCESVYCRAIEEKFLAGAMAVPEFQAAYERGAKEYKTPELRRLWLTTNLTDEIRDGYYRRKQLALRALISEAQSSTNTTVLSVMTDSKGTAYFTDVPPGTYLLTNLLPAQVGENTVLWLYEVKVKAGDAGKKTYAIPNTKDKNVKGIVVENPLPSCEANKQTASKR